MCSNLLVTLPKSGTAIAVPAVSVTMALDYKAMSLRSITISSDKPRGAKRHLTVTNANFRPMSLIWSLYKAHCLSCDLCNKVAPRKADQLAYSLGKALYMGGT